MDRNDIFFNKSLEELESIKPPSFICLDDLSDLSMNIIHNQEIDSEANYLLENENRKDTEKIENCQANVLEENVRKSRTFPIEHGCLYDATDSLRLEQENQTQNDKIQKLDLLNERNTDAKIQVSVCSSSSISDADKFSMMSNVNLQSSCVGNSNLENKNIEYCSRNTRVIDESISKVDDNNKLHDRNMVEANKESCSNEKLRLSLAPHTSYMEENNTIELDAFCLLMNELKVRAKRYLTKYTIFYYFIDVVLNNFYNFIFSNDTIWEVYHENIERNMFVIGFISCSLLVIIFVQSSSDETNDRFIKEIKIISRLAGEFRKVKWKIY